MHRSLALRVLTVFVTTLPTATSAQSVLLRVIRAESSEPLFGALAYLLDEEGQPVRVSLTDERGRALFVGVDEATYRGRAEMIGMATAETSLFVVGGDTTIPQELRMESSAISLEGIEVSAEANRCTSRPSGEGMAVARIWEEARKALSAAAYTDLSSNYRYVTVRYERDLHPATKAVLREEEARREGYMRVPFESLPAENLITNGFVQEEGGDLVYYAPDAAVLLSDAFLDTHCFRLDRIDEGAGLVGLGFEPIRDNQNTPDIAGTLWLDRATAELRWLEFSYWNLGPDVPTNEAGGRVEFRRMPAGTWIVPEWWIRMPRVRVGLGRNDTRRPQVTGYHQTGGRVLEVREAGGRALEQRSQSGGIEGVVVDSLGTLKPGVRVGVVGSNQQVFTNAEGEFTISGLTDGVYQVQFVDDRLSEVGVVPPPITREVIRGELSYVEFHVPSLREVLLEACADEPREDRAYPLLGAVLSDFRDRPVSGATVLVQWSGFQTSLGFRAIREDMTGLETTSGSDGTFRFCGLPSGEELTITSIVDGEESVPRTLRISELDGGTVHIIRR